MAYSPRRFFFFGCPVLEDLYTKEIGCHSGSLFVPLENVNVLPNLVKVRIFRDIYTPMTLLCKAKILHVEKMKISLESLPVFHNLTHLELSVHLTWLLGILPYFPKLQNFIVQDCGYVTNYCYCWKCPYTVPECISTQLKTCCIKDYNGESNEFEFAKYIMQHSKVLEKMIVKGAHLLKDEMLHKHKLSSCTRGSTRCKLLFS
ncbi:hypothetical protein P8452_19365 [Trifolium repens]|nr:hypothetical protein P8452_19365 [Trifolium repens]